MGPPEVPGGEQLRGEARAGAACEMPVSEGIALRPFRLADAPERYALIDANRDHLSRWLPWAAGQTLADTEDFIRRCQAQQAANDGFQAAVVCDGTIAGIAGFHSVDWDRRSTSIGYWLAEAQQGRGTMTAVVRALVDQALLTWRLDRVEIRAAVGNRRSRAIPERLGFAEVDTLSGAERVGDLDLDLVVYAVRAADWSSR